MVKNILKAEQEEEQALGSTKNLHMLSQIQKMKSPENYATTWVQLMFQRIVYEHQLGNDAIPLMKLIHSRTGILWTRIITQETYVLIIHQSQNILENLKEAKWDELYLFHSDTRFQYASCLPRARRNCATGFAFTISCKLLCFAMALKHAEKLVKWVFSCYQQVIVIGPNTFPKCGWHRSRVLIGDEGCRVLIEAHEPPFSNENYKGNGQRGCFNVKLHDQRKSFNRA